MTVGDHVRIAKKSYYMFTRKCVLRVGVVRTVREDGLVAIRWDGRSSDQIFHPKHLEIVSN